MDQDTYLAWLILPTAPVLVISNMFMLEYLEKSSDKSRPFSCAVHVVVGTACGLWAGAAMVCYGKNKDREDIISTIDCPVRVFADV